MSGMVVGVIVFMVTFGGAMLGMWLRRVLPEHHLNSESRDAVKLGIGLVASISALVLGLVTASAKSSFDNLDGTVKHFAADILSLDRALAQYGPETAPIRAALKSAIAHRVEMIWPKGQARPNLEPAQSTQGFERLSAEIRKLDAKSDEQKAQKDRALAVAQSMLDARWTFLAGLGAPVPTAFILTLVCWLAVTFTSFGLAAPRNATVVITLAISAMSVAGAIFMILEMGTPFEGLIRVSQVPMTYALEHMNK